MIDFTPVRTGALTMHEFAASLSLAELRRLTEHSVDRALALLANVGDAAVTFTPAEVNREAGGGDLAGALPSWPIARLVAHMTASAEECAVLAAELARGVVREGRSRSEVPWQTLATVAQCRARLLESRRIRLASLQLWPDSPRLDLGYDEWEGAGWVNAKALFVWGLAHDGEHERLLRRLLALAEGGTTP